MSEKYDNIRLEKRKIVAWVTIDRPAALNALDRVTLAGLERAFTAIGEDDTVAVAILTGCGDRAFASGADIAELAQLSEDEGRLFAAFGQAVLDRIETCGKPVIAAVNGYALGGGCELAMACTLRVASETAIFGQPEVRLGLIPGYGGSQRLPRLVGYGRALEILLTGETLTADEACRMGLVNRVVPPAQLKEAAESLALQIATNAPLALRYCMDAVKYGLSHSFTDAMEFEAKLFGKCCATADMKEGTLAFLEKRAAHFTGQ